MEASDANYQHRGLVHGPDQAFHGHLVGLLGLQIEVGVPGIRRWTDLGGWRGLGNWADA